MNPPRWLAVLLVCAVMGGGLGYLQRPGHNVSGPEVPHGTALVGEWLSTSSSKSHVGLDASEPSTDDPGKAFLQASVYASRLHRQYEMSRISRHLGSADFESFLSAWLAKPSSDFDPDIVMEIWAAEHPKAAARFMERSTAHHRLRFAMIRGWSRHDAPGAISWVMNLPESERLQALVELQKGDFQSGTPNPAAVLQAAVRAMTEAKGVDAFTTGNLRNNLRDLWRGWALHDPIAAETMARQLGDAEQQHLALRAVLSKVLESDPIRASQIFSRTPFRDESNRQAYAAMIAASLAQSDLEAASTFADAQPIGLSRSIAVSGIAKALLKSNRESAMAFVGKIPIADSSVLREFLWELSKLDPLAAIQLSAKRSDALPLDSAVRSILQTHLEEVLIGARTADHSPSIAEYLATKTEPRTQRAIVGVLQHWAAHDLPAATAWATASPAGPIREYAITGLAEGRAIQNVTEALEWVQGLQGMDYAAGIEGFAVGAFRKDPDGALAWLRTIPDANERQRRMVGAWERWAGQRDPAGIFNMEAVRWRNSSPDLTPKERELLVTPR